MMLSTSPLFHQAPFMPSHRPTRSSPLVERSANVLSPSFSFTMASQSDSQSETKKASTPQRPFKPNPVMQTRDAATQRRRNMFFRRVQRDRDDHKWEARGEQIQRLDWITDQKRWEAEKARQAPVEDEIWEDDDLEFWDAQEKTSRVHDSYERDAEEAEFLQAQEDMELEALVASMDDEQEAQEDVASQHYGSDIDDYDQIFLGYTPDTTMEQPMDSGNITFHDADAMDMTDG